MPEPSPRERPLVLVADDDDEMRSMITAFLSARGFDVIQASNGAELELLVRAASRAEEGSSLSLVLSDVRMPFASGTAALARLRASSERIRVILWSAFPDFQVRATASSLGVSAFLDKPFSLDELHRVVCAVLALPAPA